MASAAVPRAARGPPAPLALGGQAVGHVLDAQEASVGDIPGVH